MVLDLGAGAGEAVTKNPGWRALKISPEDAKPARAASDALYRLAELYPQYFGWLIQPNNETMLCAVTVAVFVNGKVRVVRAALAAAGRPAPQPAPGETAARMQ